MRLLARASALAVTALAVVAPSVWAQDPAPAAPNTFTVFLRSRVIGQEVVTVTTRDGGVVITGSGRLGPPLNLETRKAEIVYDAAWHPRSLAIDATSGGQPLQLSTAFGDGQAVSEISLAGTVSKKTDTVAPDTFVLPNAFLGSYAALARRLRGHKPGASFRAYIAPQGEVPLRLDGVFSERIDTAKQVIAATRYALIVTNPAPVGDMPISVWADEGGALLRISVPSQMLDVARDDVASAAARTSAFAVPGDESVTIPASGFNLAATVTKPAGAQGPLPALILIAGSGPADRDGFAAGIPVIGQLAAGLVNAGFLVVRYDKRGVGQSGGRSETATINDYAEDVRAIIKWLEKQRDDVDDDRIGLVGHSEGAWVAMRTAAREKRVAAVALVAAASTTGAALVLEQQRMLLERMQSPDAEKQAKIELQQRINRAAVGSGSWDGVPDALRSAADSPWFQSFLTFDPALVMRDLRQPVLIVQGSLDTQVPPHHADALAELGRKRRRKVVTEVRQIPGINHLLVPATTGFVDEYATLRDRPVSADVITAIGEWMTRMMR